MALNPPIPTLIVGLGGSGAATVMHVKTQLMNMYNNVMPDTVGLIVFDTANNPLAQFRSGKQERKSGASYGSIELEPREYGHLGGRARDLAREVVDRPDAYSHLSSWLRAQNFLKSLPENVWNLEDGAGQIRQLGRLALFVDVAAPNQSQIYQRLNERINTLTRFLTKPEESLTVFIIGSLAGGTGAGLFLDVPHLIRRLMETNNSGRGVSLRGYFFLPDAFQATLSSGQRSEANPRAFAAMRELSRLQLLETFDLGYPFNYKGPDNVSQAAIWRGKLKTKLYDLVYLMDGGVLKDHALAKGAAVSIADTIVALTDKGAQEYTRQYGINIPINIKREQDKHGRVPYVGSFGSYSLIIPIQQIIDLWAHRLAQDVLTTLLKPSELDSSTHLPLKLSGTSNEERAHPPADEARNLLSNRNPILDPRNPTRRVYPTALWQQAYQWHKEKTGSQESAVLRGMSDKPAEWWVSRLKPTASDMGLEAARPSLALETMLEKTIVKEVPSSQAQRLNPVQDNDRVRAEVKRFIDAQVGYVRDQGQRDGGRFKAQLDELVQLEIDRFRQAFDLFTISQLNGENQSDAIRARTGKLGWARAVYDEIAVILNDTLDLLIKAATQARGGATASRRTQILNDYESAEKELVDMARGGNQGRARRAQEAFYPAADAVLDLHRAELTRDAVEHVIRAMRDYVNGAIEQIDRWIGLLATHFQGLYAMVAKGQQDLARELNQDESYPSRVSIRDEQWEEARYATYSRDSLSKALERTTWDVSAGTDQRGRPAMQIIVKLNGQALQYTERGDWNVKNSELLMQMCRASFDTAREQESILDYLAQNRYAGKPNDLADLLANKTGSLITFDRNFAGAVEPHVYLLVNVQRARASSGLFLDQVTNRLRGQLGFGATDSSGMHIQETEDPFRLTLVSTVELLPMTELNAYKAMRAEYMNQQANLRPQLHVLPAEVHAVELEDRLTRELNQTRRTFSDRVVVLVEDLGRFQNFLSLMAHKVIIEDKDYLDKMNTNFVYFLVLPSKDNPNQTEDWWLTKPSGEPSLLEAMTTYIFRGEDFGRKVHSAGYTSEIPYGRVAEHLLAARRYDTTERINEGPDAVGLYRTEMRDWLNRLADQSGAGSPQFNALAASVVEHDVLYEFKYWLQTTELPRIEAGREAAQTANADGQGANRAVVENYKDLFDLYSMAILMLNEMLEKQYKEAKKAAGER